MKRLLLATTVHGYSSVMELGRRLLVPVLRRHPRSAAWDLDQRTVVVQPPSSPGGNVWIHAASLGEAKAAVRFLDILLAHGADSTFVLSATTRTGLELLKTRAGPRIIAARILPIDTVGLMSRMIDVYRVSRVWLLETELWPSLLWVCLRRQVPVGIVNARMERRSFGRYTALKTLLSPLFEHLAPVLAQSDDYAQRFRALGVPSNALHVTGNLKSLVSIDPPTPERRRSLRERLRIAAGDFVITAGCVHPGEGAIVAAAAEALAERGMRMRFCIIPRHLKATPQIMQEVGDRALWLGDAQTDALDWRVCVIERMGVMDDMYALADAAVVGGTFVPVGGHNVWDAARFGIPVFFGPVHHTQQQGCDALRRAGTGFEVADGRGLADAIMAVARDNAAQFRDAVGRLRAEMSSRQHQLERYLP